MSFQFPGGATQAEPESRPGIFSVESETLDIPMTVRADYMVTREGRVAFYTDVPDGRRDFLVASFRSDDIHAIREVEQ